jgi:hypothetical protein
VNEIEMLDARFTYTPTGNYEEERVYESILLLAVLITQEIPASRERAMTLTKLEEAFMWCERGFIKKS